MSDRYGALGSPARVTTGQRHFSPDPQHPWMDGALCRQFDPELWYSETPYGINQAKKICGDCPARQACLDHALAAEEGGRPWGVVGGLSAAERNAILRPRKQPGPRAGKPKTARCAWCGVEFSWNGGGKRVNCDLHANSKRRPAA